MKASTKRYAATGALVAGTAVVSTGCTPADLDLILTLAKIIALFV